MTDSGRLTRFWADAGARRDLRRGQHWTNWQRRKNTAIYAAVRTLFGVVDRLSPAALLELGRFVGHTAYCFGAALRARAERRLALSCHGRDAQAIARASFIRAGENLALSLLLRREGVRPSRYVSVPDVAARTLCEAVSTGQGVVFVSAHLGPFEMLAARVAEMGLSPAVVVRESYDPRLDPLVDAHRQRHGIQVIHRGKPGAAARVLGALRRSQPLGFLIDLPASVRSVSVPFLGMPSMIPVGPQRLCQRTGAQLLVGTLRRRTGGDEPHFDVRLSKATGRDELQLTQCVTLFLEREILARPDDWLWMA